jgi:hypothetical protein
MRKGSKKIAAVAAVSDRCVLKSTTSAVGDRRYSAQTRFFHTFSAFPGQFLLIFCFLSVPPEGTAFGQSKRDPACRIS